MLLKKFIGYLNPLGFFGKKESSNFNLRMMHGINRISILMFLVGMIVLVIRLMK